ncbi:MAG: tetratricopeptide repeat protein [Planctomycetota bacterium]
MRFWKRRRKSKQKKWHERTSVTLSVAAVLVFAASGFIHVIMGVVSSFDLPFDVPFDIVRKESFGYSETFVDAGKIRALPYLAAKIKYPLGCKALQRAQHMESGKVFETRMMNDLRRDMKKWQAQFDASLNKSPPRAGEQPWQDKLRGQTAVPETSPPLGTGEDANACNSRGIASARAGEYEAAISNFTRAQQKDPAFADAWYNRALVYLAIGQLGQAISDFTKVVEIEPRFTEGYINRGLIYMGMNQYDSAVSDFTRAIEIDPTLSEVYFRRSLVCYAKGEYDRAWEDVERIQSLGLSVPPEFLQLLRIVSGR